MSEKRVIRPCAEAVFFITVKEISTGKRFKVTGFSSCGRKHNKYTFHNVTEIGLVPENPFESGSRTITAKEFNEGFEVALTKWDEEHLPSFVTNLVRRLDNS